MRPNLTHVALHVPDPDAARDFFAAYCGLKVVHARPIPGGAVLWMAEPGRERDFVLVLLPGGPTRARDPKDYGHLGFAVESAAAVDALAAKATADGILLWPPRQDPWPAGYYCGVSAPDGTAVEFSYGQPLGPGAEDADAASGAFEG